MTFRNMKFFIGKNPELSKRVQEVLFSLGYAWGAGGSNVKFTDTECLYTSDDGEITHSNAEYFKNTDNDEWEEVNIDWMRAPKEELVEIDGKKYRKSDILKLEAVE